MVEEVVIQQPKEQPKAKRDYWLTDSVYIAAGSGWVVSPTYSYRRVCIGAEADIKRVLGTLSKYDIDPNLSVVSRVAFCETIDEMLENRMEEQRGERAVTTTLRAPKSKQRGDKRIRPVSAVGGKPQYVVQAATRTRIALRAAG